MGLTSSKKAFVPPTYDHHDALLPQLQELPRKEHEIQVGPVGQPGASHQRIVILSDTHNQHEKLKLPEGDILVHCGDSGWFASSKKDLVRFNKWLATVPFKHKVVIAGNHETGLDYKNPKKSKEILSNCIFLQDEEAIVEGIKFYGAPYHKKRAWWIRSSSFGISEQDMMGRWELIPNDVDFLITHVPPYGVLDQGGGGCPHLLEHSAVRVKPKVHSFGHFHGGHGAAKLGDTLYVNAAQLLGHSKNVRGTVFVLDYWYFPKDQQQNEQHQQPQEQPQSNVLRESSSHSSSSSSSSSNSYDGDSAGEEGSER